VNVPVDVREAVRRATGSDLSSAEPVGGGDINEVRRVVLTDGQRCFLKFHPGADPEMFPAEAAGLTWLGEAAQLRVPEVVAVADPSRGDAPFLLMELLESGARRQGFDQEVGTGLAALHRASPGGFGWDRDNFIGSLPQGNAARPSWPAFYREQRLLPQITRARSQGLLSDRLVSDLDRLLDRLDEVCGPAEPAARLHGDLWGGNLHVGPDGGPVHIDPAVYGGHREVDLAMMRLFGGFSERVFESYAEAWPLAPGWKERIDLYQLYPLLVHVNLFGGSYVPGVTRAVEAYL